MTCAVTHGNRIESIRFDNDNKVLWDSKKNSEIDAFLFLLLRGNQFLRREHCKEGQHQYIYNTHYGASIHIENG